jgi:protein AroM
MHNVMVKRVAFVTIGQSPRPDILSEILAETRTNVEAVERGLLDGSDKSQIQRMAPKAHEERLVSRLADGSEVLLGKPAVEAGLQQMFTALDEQSFDLIVLLCTGHFNEFRVRTPFLEPQEAVDHFTLGLTHGIDRLGILVPNEGQIEEFHGIPGRHTTVAHASPYRREREDELRAAAEKLQHCGAIVMHCMGYSEAMRRTVMKRTEKPVLLPRRIVAHAVDLLLS